MVFFKVAKRDIKQESNLLLQSTESESLIFFMRLDILGKFEKSETMLFEPLNLWSVLELVCQTVKGPLVLGFLMSRDSNSDSMVAIVSRQQSLL